MVPELARFVPPAPMIDKPVYGQHVELGSTEEVSELWLFGQGRELEDAQGPVRSWTQRGQNE